MANNKLLTRAKITPKEMGAQWKHLAHKFHLNVWNFQVRAAKEAVAIFQKSFHVQRFNSPDAKPWPPRTRTYAHRMLYEKGTLYHSIKWRVANDPGPSGIIEIYTDPADFASSVRHPGFCYAAVHNGPDSFRTGHAANIKRRQFIGHTPTLENKLDSLSSMIFTGFPK